MHQIGLFIWASKIGHLIWIDLTRSSQNSNPDVLSCLQKESTKSLWEMKRLLVIDMLLCLRYTLVLNLKLRASVILKQLPKHPTDLESNHSMPKPTSKPIDSVLFQRTIFSIHITSNTRPLEKPERSNVGLACTCFIILPLIGQDGWFRRPEGQTWGQWVCTLIHI